MCGAACGDSTRKNNNAGRLGTTTAATTTTATVKGFRSYRACAYIVRLEIAKTIVL